MFDERARAVKPIEYHVDAGSSHLNSSHLVMAQHQSVQVEQALLEPCRRNLCDLVVIQHQSLQRSELRKHRRRHPLQPIAGGVENGEITQWADPIQTLTRQLVRGRGEIGDLVDGRRQDENSRDELILPKRGLDLSCFMLVLSPDP